MATLNAGINKGYGSVPVYDKNGQQVGTKADVGGTGGNIVTQPGWNAVSQRAIGMTPETPMYTAAGGIMRYGSDPNKAGTVTTGPNFTPVGSAAYALSGGGGGSPAQKLSTTIGSSSSGSSDPTDWDAVRKHTLQAYDIEAATADKQAEAGALRRGIEGGVLGSVLGYQSGQNQIGRERLLADLLREQRAAWAQDQDMQIRRESIAASERAAAARGAESTWGDLAQRLASGSAGERNTQGDGGGGTFGATFKYPTNSVAPQAQASAPAQDITRMTTAQLKSLRNNAYARKAGGEYSWLPYNSQTNDAIDAELARRRGNVDPTRGVAGLFTDAYGNPL